MILFDKRNDLLNAINGLATLIFSEEKDLIQSIKEGLSYLGKCMDFDRINVWKAHEEKDKSFVLYFGWHADDKFELPNGDKPFEYKAISKNWLDSLFKGVCQTVSNLDLEEKTILEKFNIKTLLVSPVYIKNKFWGYVSYEDCIKERSFGDSEINMLKTASLMLANALNREVESINAKQADELARILLDATPLCCNIWNEKLENIECNEAAVKLFKLSKKQDYLDGFLSLSPKYQPDGEPSLKKSQYYINKAFKEGKCTFEWMHQLKDGTPIPAEITLVRMKRGSENIICGYTRDLSQYNDMMQKIAYKDTLLRVVNDVAANLLQANTLSFEKTLYDSMRMISSAVKVDRVYVWKNHMVGNQLYCTQMYEWSEGVEAQQGNELTIDIPYTETAPGWEEALSNGRCINGVVKDMSPETRAQLEAQDVRSILVVPVFLRDKFWGFVGFDDCKNERIFTADEENILRSGSLLLANALLRNQIELEQRQVASKMEAVLKNYTGIIFSVDSNYKITLFSGLYINQIGIEPQMIEGKNLNIVKSKNRHLDILEKVTETLKGVPQEWVSEVDDKKFRAHTTPIFEEDGSVSAVVGSLEDITNTARLQSELEKALNNARDASNAKSEFLSNMSHEMRTPLNAIIGMTAIAKTSQSTEKKDYCLDKIESSSANLLGVINDILDMSKIEANKFSLSEIEFNFEKVLQKAVNVVNFKIDEKRQEFMIHIDENIPQRLIGDDQRLIQVLTNLLSNAIKFTPEEGSIRLHINVSKDFGKEIELEVSIVDTGIGISKEHQKKLFSSFQQAESSTSRRFGGTGLGLAISKRIVEMMDGAIWVESELNKGSKFAFRIKLKKGENKNGKILPLEARSVLIVDDSQDVLEYFTQILKRTKLKVDTAISGEDAINLIDENDGYDIYFIDWRMPTMDGLQLTRHIKQRYSDRAVVIMISSTEWTHISEDAKTAGVDRFLAKPLFPSSIIDCLNECLGGLKQRKEKKPTKQKVSFNGGRMLLAEDVEINREIVLAMLQDTGIEIDCAVNGKIAIEMFQKNPDKYDMIFMDIQMPEMDGLAATEIIRAMDLKKAKEIPIVAMTANVFKEDVDKCIKAGMNGHIGKPLDFDEVIELMKTYIKNKKID